MRKLFFEVIAIYFEVMAMYFEVTVEPARSSHPPNTEKVPFKTGGCS